ncbi:hypothetical protein D3C72_1578240 [compost metagenome]
MPSRRTPASKGLAAAAAIIAAPVAASPAPPCAVRSCTFMEKPEALPMEGMGGGFKANINACGMARKLRLLRPTSASTASLRAVRSPHGYRSTNDSAAVCPWPKKLNPTTDATLRTADCWRSMLSACSTASCV